MISQKQKTAFNKMNNLKLNEYLISACTRGDLGIVKYLLTSPELKEHADIHYLDDNALICACSEGNLNIVKYLLTNQNLKEHANINAQNDEALQSACSNNNLEIVKYLLTSPDLKIHANDNRALISAFLYGHFNIIEYLIWDYRIEKDKYTDYFISTHDVLNQMFEKRVLEEKLNVYLQNNKVNRKIKL